MFKWTFVVNGIDLIMGSERPRFIYSIYSEKVNRIVEVHGVVEVQELTKYFEMMKDF